MGEEKMKYVIDDVDPITTIRLSDLCSTLYNKLCTASLTVCSFLDDLICKLFESLKIVGDDISGLLVWCYVTNSICTRLFRIRTMRSMTVCRKRT